MSKRRKKSLELIWLGEESGKAPTRSDMMEMNDDTREENAAVSGVQEAKDWEGSEELWRKHKEAEEEIVRLEEAWLQGKERLAEELKRVYQAAEAEIAR